VGRQTQTRERLVETAAELFWTQGYAQTGVSSIMKRARATSGSFYHFFPTKDDLLLAVLDAVGEWLEAEVLDRAESASKEPLGRIAALAAAYRGRVAPGATGFGLPVGSLVSELAPGNPAALDAVERIYRRLVSRIAGWIANAGGRRTAAEEARSLGEFVVGSLEGAALLALASRSTAPVDACAEQLALRIEDAVGDRTSSGDDVHVPRAGGRELRDWKAW